MLLRDSNSDTKIVIAGGRQKSDFLIGMLLEQEYELIVINEDAGQCQYLAEKYKIPIFWGEPASMQTLYEAEIENADVVIALRQYDADNLMICQAAKKVFGIKKTVAVVSNPKNVTVFKELGIQTVISATYTVANIIEQASVVGDIVNTLSIEDERVVMTKIKIGEDSPVLGKQIQDIKMPDNIIVSCILRETGVVVPNGQTVVAKDDYLMIISDPALQRKIVEVMTGKRKVK